ncbi:hypothetical protein HOLleu_23704 [Holothuria leucospilota]|uniref:Uncharacterized protein n=1 Tax=Holothuria leucospilota TaxID=206669 RepID=A0A9Q1BVS2_HOLLE|nr:hypothetical protein HOLleu_23704 [Holothuria leucospilota]
MLQTAFLLNRSGIMEPVSIFAALTFNLFVFLSSLNVAKSEEDNNRAVASVRSISDLFLTTGVFLLIVVGIVFCGFCSKSKRKGSSSSEKDRSLPDCNTLCLENSAIKNGDVGASDDRDWGQDSDIYDCVNETADTQLSRTLDACNQEESRADDVTSDEIEMVYNVAYQSIDCVQNADFDDSDLYDQVGPKPEEGTNKSDAVKSSLKSTKKTVGISLSQPSNVTMVSCSEDANTASVQKEPLHRMKSAPHNIKSGTKNKPGKAMTLHVGAGLRTPLDPLPEEDYLVTERSSEVRNGSSDSKASQVVKEKSQTLKPHTRRHPDGDALVYELCKVQEMRKGAINKYGGTLPPLRNWSEKMTEDGNDQSAAEEHTSQEVGTEEMPVTCQSTSDDTTSQQSVSSCSDKSDPDSFESDSLASAEDDSSIQGNEQSDIVAMDTSEPDEQCEDSQWRGSKHNYVNVDATTDFHSEISDEDEDTEIYDNLGANRDGVCEVTPETGVSVQSQEFGTSSDNGIGLPTVDTNQVYATCRYEDAKVGIQRRSTLLKKATLVKEVDETDENDDIFYPNQVIEGNDQSKEDESNASRSVIEQAELDTPTAHSFSTHDNPSQKRPHKIFTNESFLRIQEAIAMQQALNNNNPAQRLPVFSSRYRVQRFSL